MIFNGSQLESFHLVIYPSVVHLDPVTGSAVSALGSCVLPVVTDEPADVPSVPAGTGMDHVAR